MPSAIRESNDSLPMKVFTFCFGHNKVSTVLCCAFQYTSKEDDELTIETKHEKCRRNSHQLQFPTVSSCSAASTMISQPPSGGAKYLQRDSDGEQQSGHRGSAANGDTTRKKATEICVPVSKRSATLLRKNPNLNPNPNPNPNPDLKLKLSGRPIPHYPNPSNPSTCHHHTMILPTAVQSSLVGKQSESMNCPSSLTLATATGSNPPPMMMKPFTLLPLLSYHNKGNAKCTSSVDRLNFHQFKCTTTRKRRILSKLKYYIYPDMVQL